MGRTDAVGVLRTCLSELERRREQGWVAHRRADGSWSVLGESAVEAELRPGFGRPDVVEMVARFKPPSRGRRTMLLGYEASACLAGGPHHAPEPELGPIGFVRLHGAGLDIAPTGEVTRWGRATSETWPNDGLTRTSAGSTAAEPALDYDEVAKARHQKRVEACREHLAAGVLYQANLCHRLDVEHRSRQEAIELFLAAVDREHPPALASLVDVPGWGLIVSLTPETLVRWSLARRWAAAFPIKGTRPRGASAAEDQALLDELLASAKDRAEHVMIVDLLRNDLGRVADVGGVTVSELLAPLTVPNVHHLVSTVEAQLRPDVGLTELFEALAPGGSITGAPKSAALEVIRELEDGPRGAYTGNLAWVDEEGEGEASILIRTWLRPDVGWGSLHVGGGIVIDSDPEAEWQETLDKAAAFGRPTCGKLPQADE